MGKGPAWCDEVGIRCAAERRPGSSSKIDVGECVAVGVADDVAVLAELHVGVIDRPGRREAASIVVPGRPH
jgi:hypothetical protein